MKTDLGLCTVKDMERTDVWTWPDCAIKHRLACGKPVVLVDAQIFNFADPYAQTQCFSRAVNMSRNRLWGFPTSNERRSRHMSQFLCKSAFSSPRITIVTMRPHVVVWWLACLQEPKSHTRWLIWSRSSSYSENVNRLRIEEVFTLPSKLGVDLSCQINGKNELMNSIRWGFNQPIPVALWIDSCRNKRP